MAKKVKNYKMKTHKASKKRFKVTATGKLIHGGQDGGNAASYKNRRQKKSSKSQRALSATKEQKKIRNLIGK